MGMNLRWKMNLIHFRTMFYIYDVYNNINVEHVKHCEYSLDTL